MTRDEEIEALAMVYCEGYAAAAMPASVLDQFFAEGVLRAEAILAARDRYRAARQPAPETPTPTPRIEVLKRWLECCVALNFSASVWDTDEDLAPYSLFRSSGKGIYVEVSRSELEALRQHAATLKERKEQADA